MTTGAADVAINAQKPITTVDELQAHLKLAAQVELSTVPLYLYAAYSIKTQSYSQWNPGMSAFRAIRSVVIEEMLHLALARNLLVAVGGGDGFKFNNPHFIPRYPHKMLHRVPPLMLRLEPCSVDLMRTVFMPLELPEKVGAPDQPDHYNSLGQFYAAVRLGFETLDGPDLWRNPHPDLQYTNTYWNQDGGGNPIVVHDLETALQAIDTIVEQGEGASGHSYVPDDPAAPVLGLDELSHYAKFHRIAEGIDMIGDVWPVPTDPSLKGYESELGGPGAPLCRLANLFNASYCYLLSMIDAIYSTSRTTVSPGQYSPRYGLERTFIAAMNGLLFPIANLLVEQPLSSDRHAAPTFEYYEFAEGSSKKDQLESLCDGLLGHYPVLGGDDGVRRLMQRLPSV
jgi:hypothetical protein